MPKFHKIYPNCIWQVPPEWFGLNFSSVLLTNVYWIYTTHNVLVCLSPLSLIDHHLHVSKRSNIHVRIGSKAMASLYELLCHHSLTITDTLFEELLSYLPNRFPSYFFDSLHMKTLIMNQSDQSTPQFLRITPTIQLFLNL